MPRLRTGWENEQKEVVVRAETDGEIKFLTRFWEGDKDIQQSIKDGALNQTTVDQYNVRHVV